MFEKYFREEQIDKKYKTYRAHLYLIFRYSLGEYPPTFTRSRALESYCDRLLGTLKEPLFGQRVRTVLEVFDETYQVWTQNRSRFSIKDNKDFTELLINQARKRFLKSQPPQQEETKEACAGEILRIISRNGVWFGWIRRGMQHENVYFDSRGYRGEPGELIPNRKVSFEIGRNDKGSYAKNVVLTS
jgi:cold shock CspA family protein